MRRLLSLASAVTALFAHGWPDKGSQRFHAPGRRGRFHANAFHNTRKFAATILSATMLSGTLAGVLIVSESLSAPEAAAASSPSSSLSSPYTWTTPKGVDP
ncbi:MAG: hypothetical protein ACYDGY_08670, partial [Acidimicrobiales bacterium]